MPAGGTNDPNPETFSHSGRNAARCCATRNQTIKEKMRKGDKNPKKE
jgi:hypothetical protein